MAQKCLGDACSFCFEKCGACVGIFFGMLGKVRDKWGDCIEITSDKIAEKTGLDDDFIKDILAGMNILIVIFSPMLLLALPPPEGGVFDKGSGGQEGPDICPTASFEYAIYHFFYKEECARRMKPPVKGDSSTCGVEVVNQVLHYFVGELRIEAQCFGGKSIFLLLCC